MISQMTKEIPFENLKFMVNQTIHRLRKVLHELELHERMNELDGIHYSLNEVPFQLAVVGDFSRGKSTFINALLGDDILPSKTIPTTTFITHIVHAEKEEIVLSYEDDVTKKVDLKTFKTMKAPRQPDESDEEEMAAYNKEVNDLAMITRATVNYPLPYEHTQQFEIVDTPGMNDVFDQREAITRGYLPHSDAILFVLSATSPISESEMAFLEREILSKEIRNVFFILNFKDRLKTREEEQRVIQYIYDQLGVVQDLKDVHVYLLSSLEALQHKQLDQGMALRKKPKTFKSLEETGFLAFESDLSHFLQYEQGKVKAAKEIRRLMKMTQTIQNEELTARQGALKQDKEKLSAEMSLLDDKVKELKEDMKSGVETSITALVRQEMELIKSIEEEQAEVRSAVLKRLDPVNMDQDLEDVDIESYMDIVMKDLKTRYSVVTEKMDGEIERLLHESFEEITGKLTAMAEKFNHEQPDELSGVLGFSGTSFTSDTKSIMSQMIYVVQSGTRLLKKVTSWIPFFDVLTDFIDKSVMKRALETARTDVDGYMADENRKQLKKLRKTFKHEVKKLEKDMFGFIKRSHNLYKDNIKGIQRDLRLTGEKHEEKEKEYHRLSVDLADVEKSMSEIYSTYCEEEMAK